LASGRSWPIFIKRGEASRIDWSDEDAVEFGIDWSL